MIKRLALLLAAFVLAAPLALAQTSTWVPDKAHSEVGFSILHMSLAKVSGRFGNIGGTVALNDADITKSTINVTIDVNTVDTGVDSRDSDLKGDHFFDVAQFPTAAFVSTGISKSGDGLTVSGNLTLHGVTKPVTLEVEKPTGPLTAMGKTHMGFSATTTLKRTDFGIGTKYPSTMIGDDVKLTIDLDLTRQ